MSASEIKNLISRKKWDSYFKFCFERNPWDKTLSHHFMKKFRSNNTLSLNEYFENKSFPVDRGKYAYSTGEFLVDRVFLYEKIDSELSEVCNILNIPFPGTLPYNAKSKYRTDRRHYREILSKSESKIIAEKFEKEINWFNYSY